MNSDYIFIVFAVLLSLTSLIPELYARIKNKLLWTPVAAPPEMLGDDYHYFSINNQVLENLKKPPFNFLKNLAENSKYQILVYIFNAPLIWIGEKIEDKRFGFLLVKFVNRTLLFYTAFIIPQKFTTAILKDQNEIISASLLIGIIFFLTYPGVSEFKRLSILYNLSKNDHIYKNAHLNNLTRACILETSAPFLLAFFYLIVICHSNSSNLNLLVIITSAIGFFFVYGPLALFTSGLTAIYCIFEKHYAVLGCFLICAATIFYRYNKFLQYDVVGKSFFSTKKITLSINKKKIVHPLILIILLFGLSIYLNLNIFFQILAVFSVVPMILKITDNPGLNRIWDRGSLPIFHLLFTTFITGALIKSLKLVTDTNIAFYLTFIFCCLFIYFLDFLIKNSKYLYLNNSTKLSKQTGLLLKKLNQMSLKKEICTDNITLAYLLQIFSNKKTLIKNYSIQNCSFSKNIQDIIKNFYYCKYSKQLIYKIMTAQVEYSDWVERRPFQENDIITKEKCKIHSIQYLATNREYNRSLQEKKYTSDAGLYTQKYKTFIRKSIKNVTKNNLSKYCIIKDKN